MGGKQYCNFMNFQAEHKTQNNKETTLSGFGPKSTQALASIGIYSLDELKTQDVYDVYRQLKEQVPGTSLNLMYALIAAVEGGDWREIQKLRRTEILLRLDELGLAPK